jgi:hypothetical protein
VDVPSKKVSELKAGPGPFRIKVKRPRMAIKTSAVILMATMITPKLAPMVRDARLRTVTIKMATIAVICNERRSHGQSGPSLP